MTAVIQYMASNRCHHKELKTKLLYFYSIIHGNYLLPIFKQHIILLILVKSEANSLVNVEYLKASSAY